jgi:hypothetical protein
MEKPGLRVVLPTVLGDLDIGPCNVEPLGFIRTVDPDDAEAPVECLEDAVARSFRRLQVLVEGVDQIAWLQVIQHAPVALVSRAASETVPVRYFDDVFDVLLIGDRSTDFVQSARTSEDVW